LNKKWEGSPVLPFPSPSLPPFSFSPLPLPLEVVGARANWSVMGVYALVFDKEGNRAGDLADSYVELAAKEASSAVELAATRKQCT